MAVQGPAATADLEFGLFADEASDDLPRTLRREKEARAREARERAAQERAAAPSLSTGQDDYSGPRPQVYRSADIEPRSDDHPAPATVRRFDVPFVHLATFFIKAVLAGIPALILLGVILWFAGALAAIAVSCVNQDENPDQLPRLTAFGIPSTCRRDLASRVRREVGRHDTGET